MKKIKEITKYSLILAVLITGFVIPNVSKAQLYTPLQVSCYPNTYSAQPSSLVVWYASAVGGDGIYTYSWSGTDGLSGYTNSISRYYYTTGNKTAFVTVNSNGQSMSVNCGNVNVSQTQNYYPYYYNYGTLDGACSANITSAQIGTTINWSASASGGNGIYTYSWSDSDGYTSSGQYLSRYYTYAGYKNAIVTITSNGQSINRSCSVYIVPSGTVANNSTYPIYPTYSAQNPTRNQVLAYNDTNPALSSVYLNDVPYTGLEDINSSILFVITLISWSAILAYIFLRNKLNPRENNMETYL